MIELDGNSIKERIDKALRDIGPQVAPRNQVIVSLNRRSYQHIRSWVLNGIYRGASVVIREDQLEDWVIQIPSASRSIERLQVDHGTTRFPA